MKKVILSLFMMLNCIVAMAQQWYYIPAGRSPEDNLGQYNPVHIVVKDNSGQLWHLSTPIETLRQNLLNNRDYYVDAFNKGSHPVYHTGLHVGNIYDGLSINIDNPDEIDEDIIETKVGSFSRMIVEEKTAKSYVFTCRYFGNVAISHDFETLVADCNKVNPRYYTSIPVDRFIVRRSVDDLF